MIDPRKLMDGKTNVKLSIGDLEIDGKVVAFNVEKNIDGTSSQHFDVEFPSYDNEHMFALGSKNSVGSVVRPSTASMNITINEGYVTRGFVDWAKGKKTPPPSVDGDGNIVDPADERYPITDPDESYEWED